MADAAHSPPHCPYAGARVSEPLAISGTAEGFGKSKSLLDRRVLYGWVVSSVSIEPSPMMVQSQLTVFYWCHQPQSNSKSRADVRMSRLRKCTIGLVVDKVTIRGVQFIPRILQSIEDADVRGFTGSQDDQSWPITLLVTSTQLETAYE